MAVYDLEEQEQLSELKAWWARYGGLVTAAAVVAAIGSVAWQGWQWYQRKQSGEASGLYAIVEQAAAEKNAARAREAAGHLFESFGGTPYADLAALLSAKTQVDAGDPKNAKAQLSWAVEHGNDPALRDLARLRLASLLFDEKAYDEALAKLASEPLPAFKSTYAELRGDILAEQNKPAEARTAYQAALDSGSGDNDGDNPSRRVIETKLQALGGQR